MRFSYSLEVVVVPLCSLEQQQQMKTDNVPWKKNTQKLTLISLVMNKTVCISGQKSSFIMYGPTNYEQRFAFGLFASAEKKGFSKDILVSVFPFSLCNVHCGPSV